MSELKYIPKILKPRRLPDYDQKIPRVIWQTMKTNQVTPFIKSYTDTWINLNPEYEYRFYDDNDIIDFLTSDFPDYLDGYKKLKFGASKADLWRYLIIYKYGGVYADIDCRCINSLHKWVDRKSTYVTQLGINKDICQWLIISVPQNPIFLTAAKLTLQQSAQNSKKISYYGFDYIEKKLVIRKATPIKFSHEVLSLSGPPVLQKAAEECFKSGLIKSILNDLQIICVSDSISCQMNGNVKHDTGDIEYKKSYKTLKLKHYNSRTQRIKRRIINFFNLLNPGQA